MKINFNIFSYIKNNMFYKYGRILFYIKKEIIAIIKSMIYLVVTFVSFAFFFLYTARFVNFHGVDRFIIAVMSFTLFFIVSFFLINQPTYTIPDEDTNINPLFKSTIKAIDLARYLSIFGTIIYSILKILEWGDKYILSLK
jgi:hypothetical protein